MRILVLLSLCGFLTGCSGDFEDALSMFRNGLESANLKMNAFQNSLDNIQKHVESIDNKLK